MNFGGQRISPDDLDRLKKTRCKDKGTVNLLDVFYRNYRGFPEPYDEKSMETLLPYLRKKYPWVSRRLGRKQLYRLFYITIIGLYLRILAEKMVEGHVIKLHGKSVYLGIFGRANTIDSKLRRYRTKREIITESYLTPTPLLIQFDKKKVTFISWILLKRTMYTEVVRKWKQGFKYVKYNDFREKHAPGQIYQSQDSSC